MSTETALTQILQGIEELKKIIQDQGTLGLTQGRRFIYIEKTKNSIWAFVDNDEAVDATALTGYISEIYRKEDEHPKLHIVVRTREVEYVLCSGFETHFSRDVMAAIAQLKPQQLKRPLKIVPTVKEPKPGEKQSNHQPVYANVLLDDQTIRTFQLKRDLSAQDLYERAIAVLKGGNKAKASQGNAYSQESRKVVTKSAPPGLDDELPPMKAIAPNAASQGDDQNTECNLGSVDWKAFCQQYRVLPNALKDLAKDLGLPVGKLDPGQSATLYKAAWEKFVEPEAV